MDKYPAYPGAIPLTGNWESPQRATEIALGFIMQAAFGTGTVIDGLAVTQTVVPGMGVLVGPGSIIFATTVDTLASGFGSIAYDGADPLVKIGINLTSTTMSSLTAPATAGQSQNWLVEVQFLEADTGGVVLPYYNAANPAVPYTGPANAGTPNNTARTNRVQLQWKGGTAATTGTQNTPSPDAGWFGIAVVTIANGQSTILNANVTAYSASPYVPTKLAFQRTRLTANLNLYVATTGSDTANSGLSLAAPFATMQKAWNTVVNGFDLNGFTVTVNVGNGTYTSGVVCVGMPPGMSSTNSMTGNPANCIFFTGNVGSPSSVIISVSNTNCFVAQSSCEIVVSGFTLLATGSAGAYQQQGCGIYAIDRGGVVFGNVIFGACSQSHITSANGGFISSNAAPYSITGGAAYHVNTSTSSYVTATGSTVTLIGTPAFAGAFANAANGSLALFNATVFSGAATGTRYIAQTCGIINTIGGGATFLPGNAAGATATGGQYT